MPVYWYDHLQNWTIVRTIITLCIQYHHNRQRKCHSTSPPPDGSPSQSSKRAQFSPPASLPGPAYERIGSTSPRHMPSLAMYEENMLSLSVSNLRSLKGIHLSVCKTDRYSMAEQHCRLLTADIEHGILNLYRDRASEDQKLSINLKCFSLTILYHSTVSPTFIFRFRIWRYNGRVVTLLSDKRCNRNISSWWHFDDCQQETGEVSVMDIQVYGSPPFVFCILKRLFFDAWPNGIQSSPACDRRSKTAGELLDIRVSSRLFRVIFILIISFTCNHAAIYTSQLSYRNWDVSV